MKRLPILLSALLFLGLTAAAPAAGAGPAPTSPATAPPGSRAPAAGAYRWEQRSLPSGVAASAAWTLAVDPQNAGHLLAFVPGAEGLYQSANGGATWQASASMATSTPEHIAFAPGQASRAYLHDWTTLYVSDDGGGTWPIARAYKPDACGFVVAPTAADRLYAWRCASADKGGLYRSSDGGQNWTEPAATFTATVNVLAVSPASADVLVAGTGSGTFRSTNGGLTWAQTPLDDLYGTSLVFDPASPYVLYASRAVGLARSLDAAATGAAITWQDSGSGFMDGPLVVSPIDTGEAMGAASSTGWRLRTSDSAWTMVQWPLPGAVDALWRSAGDSSALYAKTASGQLWRYVASGGSLTHTVLLPAALRLSTAQMGADAASEQAVTRANVYRGRAGVAALAQHPALVLAAQNHAAYWTQNVADSSAWANGRAGEVAGKPGFTGRLPADRARVAGYPWAAGSEIWAASLDPTAAIDLAANSVYRRVALLSPWATHLGYGSTSGLATAGVVDLATGPAARGAWLPLPTLLAYPADGQTGVPLAWSGDEDPSPLPAGVPGPVGYPFTLQAAEGVLEVTSAVLSDGHSTAVAVYPSPAACETTYGCYAVLPQQPLQPNMRYTVTAQGTIDGELFDRSWSFTTVVSGRQGDAE